MHVVRTSDIRRAAQGGFMTVIGLPSLNISQDILWHTPRLSFALMCHIVNGTPIDEELGTVATQQLADWDFLYVLAVMCAPDDPSQAERLFDALCLEDLYIATQILGEGGAPVWSSMSCATAIAIAHRPPVGDLVKQLVSKKWLAHIACGYILRRIISRHQHNPGRATFADAAATIEHFCQRNSISGGMSQNVIRHLWPQYKSVAHLWAAWSAIQDSGLGEQPIERWFPTFCGTSQWLLEQGAAIVLSRSNGQTVLDPEHAWILPESRVSRSSDGAIVNRVWSNDLEDHDLRCKRMPTNTHPL
jgi:hypothetical protein